MIELESIYEALTQAQDCIRGESPEDISDEEAREDTISKIRDAMRTIEAMQAPAATPRAICATPPADLLDLAESIHNAREAYLNSIGTPLEATCKAGLEQILWNDKGTFAPALRLAAGFSTRTAPAGRREDQGCFDSTTEWRDIDTAPLDEEVLMGWWREWPERRWESASGLAGSKRGGWLHGQATHWQPLPSPPCKLSRPPRSPQDIVGGDVSTSSTGNE